MPTMPAQTTHPQPQRSAVDIILALYGFVPQSNHRGQHYYCATKQWKGETVRCCLGRPGLRSLPRHLSDPVWVGYYGQDAEGAMLDDEFEPNLLAFLKRQARPLRFAAPLLAHTPNVRNRAS